MPYSPTLITPMPPGDFAACVLKSWVGAMVVLAASHLIWWAVTGVAPTPEELRASATSVVTTSLCATLYVLLYALVFSIRGISGVTNLLILTESAMFSFLATSLALALIDYIADKLKPK